MTQLNPPLFADAAAPPERPTSVAILGLAGMVIGALGTVGCGLHQLLESWTVGLAGGYPLPNGAVVPADRRYFAFTTAAAALDLLTSATLFFTTYLAWRLSPAGRRWAVIVAAAIVALAAAKLAGGLGPFRQSFVDLKLAALAAQSPEERKNVPADVGDTIRRMSYISPLIQFALQATVPALIAIFWTRPAVREAFEDR